MMQFEDVSIPTFIGGDLAKMVSSGLSGPGDSGVLVIDANVAQHHLDYLAEAFSNSFDKLFTIIVPAGEGSKKLQVTVAKTDAGRDYVLLKEVET